jgi:hypothetical protein
MQEENCKKNNKVLFVDLAMYDNLQQLLSSFNIIVDNFEIDFYVSLEWKERLTQQFVQNDIYGYEYRGVVSNLFNIKYAWSKRNVEYDLIIINSGYDKAYLKYFIFNLLFLRSSKVYVVNSSEMTVVNVYDYLLAVTSSLFWLLNMLIEFIISLLLYCFLILSVNIFKFNRWTKKV